MEAELQALARAVDRDGVRLALLFGSRAQGRATPASDWDVGLVVSRLIDWLGWMSELAAWWAAWSIWWT